MNKAIYSFFLILLFSLSSTAQVVTFGTATTTNTAQSYPNPYGNYFYGARHQFIIRASEITGSSINGAKLITSLAFNVKTSTGQPLQNFTIRLKNTSLTAFNTSGPGAAYETDLSEVYTVPTFTEITGWNTHTFQKGFYWDGVSNVVVEVCFNNSSWVNSHAIVFLTTVGFQSTLYNYGDNMTNCSNAPSFIATQRPNMRLNFTTVPLPDASFKSADTLFVNSTYTFKNTSTNTVGSYWKVYGKNSPLCNSYGCFLDTTNKDLRVTFNETGFYVVKLVTPGYTGYDSAMHNIYIDQTHVKPKARFSSNVTTIATPDLVNFYDSSQNGAFSWHWYISPECFNCNNNPFQIPNYFSPSPDVQNPQLNVFDGGVFDVCLVASNDKGSDTICKKNYLKVIQGYSMCNGADSFTAASSGYVFDPGGPTQNYQAFLTGNCKSGFVISPENCADSIVLSVQQFRSRPSDTLEVRDGPLPTSPLIRKIAGINIPAAAKTLVAKSGHVYMRFYASNFTSPPGDSGFAVTWNTVGAAKLYYSKATICPGDNVVLKVNKKIGRTYSWYYNDNLIIGESDTFYVTTTPGTYKAIVTGNGCVDSNSIEINTAPKVATGFTVNKTVQCFFTNSFAFADTSIYPGTYTRQWSFGDNSTSAAANITKKYAISGTLKVRLITTTPGGCKDSMIQFVSNNPSPNSKITFQGASADLCEWDSIRLVGSAGQGYKYQWFYNGIPLAGDTIVTMWTSHPGVYRVKTTTTLGCDSMSAPLLIKGKPLPQRPLITKDGFVLTSSPATAYQWLVNDNPINGANQQTYVPTTPGYYSVTADSANGCRNTSWQVLVSSTTGMSDVSALTNFTLFPNPATGSITASQNVPFVWSITDITGRIVMKGTASQPEHNIDLSGLNEGIYLFTADSESGTVIRKLEKR